MFRVSNSSSVIQRVTESHSCFVDVWTLQGIDFDPRSDPLEWEKSAYFSGSAHVRRAYRALEKRLGTKQFVWCYTRHGDWPSPIPADKLLWALRVPFEAVIRFVDPFVWSRLLKKTKGLAPYECERAWNAEARLRYPMDKGQRDEHSRKRRTEYWKLPSPSGNWWNELFVDYAPPKRVTALVRLRIKASWEIPKSLATGKKNG
jgi:hypothetical protein